MRVRRVGSESERASALLQQLLHSLLDWTVSERRYRTKNKS